MVITQEELKARLRYDLNTGVFTHRISAGGRKVGAKAGSCVRGYIKIGVMYQSYLAHRLAWLYIHGEWPKMIDHINHDRADNRMDNLREVSNAQNMRNAKMYSSNTSGVMGVSWMKHIKKWDAFIYREHRKKSLGYFSDKQEAINVRKEAERQMGYHKNHGLVHS